MSCLPLSDCFAGLDVTMQAAWIGVGGALIGALVGGALAALATWLTTRAQLKHAERARRFDRLVDVLVSLHEAVIHAELGPGLSGSDLTGEEEREVNEKLWRLLQLAKTLALPGYPGMSAACDVAVTRTRVSNPNMLNEVQVCVERFLRDPKGEDQMLGEYEDWFERSRKGKRPRGFARVR